MLSDPLGGGGLCPVGRTTQVLVAASVTVRVSDHSALVKPLWGRRAGKTVALVAEIHSAAGLQCPLVGLLHISSL